MYFRAAGSNLTSVPASWTSLCLTDPFVDVAAGRSLFRIEDLLELAALVGLIRKSESGTCKVNNAGTVKIMMSSHESCRLTIERLNRHNTPADRADRPHEKA